ncbi:probable ion channel POLLUX [Cryptomeria japonica]|uniref:probable ion channel POLLUX n=1 Tax=Cryptomeria japonica TaxID=3369 RepID=UPI0027DA2144|nr:probable ion channel POLLUX [Cryptomeria japonica]
MAAESRLWRNESLSPLNLALIRNEEEEEERERERRPLVSVSTSQFRGPLLPTVRRTPLPPRDWYFPSNIRQPPLHSPIRTHDLSGQSSDDEEEEEEAPAAVAETEAEADAEAEAPECNPESNHNLRISNHLRSSTLASCSSIIQGCYGQLNFMLAVTCVCCAAYAWLMHSRAHELEERLRVYERTEGEGWLATTEIWAALASTMVGVYWLKDVQWWRKEGEEEEEVALKKRIAYRVDVVFSVYPYAKLLALLGATMMVIGMGGVAVYLVESENLGDALWLSWSFVADSGSHAESEGTGPRMVAVAITSGGMLIFAMMLGLVSDAISEKVDSLRKGKSEVIERNHILILGWSDKLGSLLKQLAIANQSLGGGVVVVLAERDKEEMELDIAKLEFDFMGTSVICRSGSPLIMADLKKVSVSKARAIIVLATDGNADQSDAHVLRVVLSLIGVKEGLRGHVVVEMSDIDNEQLVKLVGGDLVETVVAHDVIGRLMIQCALQPGLAQIWEDILGFDGAEFYIKRWPQLDGMRFEDILISFPNAVPCGVKLGGSVGRIILNPDNDFVLREGDEVLVVAEDDDTYAPGPLPQVRRGFLPKVFIPPKFPEKILFCGWRRDIDDMIMVLEALLAPDSELWMFNEVPLEDRENKLFDGGLDLSGLENITLVHRKGNAVIRRHLESLPLETFDSILILADESLEGSVVHSDSRSLATLLLIRDIQSKRLPYREPKVTQLRQAGYSHSSWIREMQQASDKSIIISEILDSRTRNLVSVSKISDYVLSNELVSMALAMVAEDKQINRVLEELFAEEGNELYIRPAEFYIYDQEELNFYEIMLRGRQRKEVVIGYRLASAERAVINPPDKGTGQKWSLGDVFIVISQE